MVKGSTRQVILVKSPDPKLFEEAIFIVRDEALRRQGVTADAAIAEAKRAADNYLRNGRLERARSQYHPALWSILGAVVASAGWAGWVFLL